MEEVTLLGSGTPVEAALLKYGAPYPPSITLRSSWQLLEEVGTTQRAVPKEETAIIPTVQKLRLLQL